MFVTLLIIVFVLLHPGWADPSAGEVHPVGDDDVQIADYKLGDLDGNYVVATWRDEAYTFHYDDVVTYDDAESGCALYAVPVVSIETKAEQNVIQALIKKVRNYEQYSSGVWINAHYHATCEYYSDGHDNIFYQTDPRISLGYSNWLPPEEPRTQDGNCVAITFSGRFKWWTYDCGSKSYTYICEWDRCARWKDNEARCNREGHCVFDRGDGFCYDGASSRGRSRLDINGTRINGQRRRMLRSSVQKQVN